MKTKTAYKFRVWGSDELTVGAKRGIDARIRKLFPKADIIWDGRPPPGGRGMFDVWIEPVKDPVVYPTVRRWAKNIVLDEHRKNGRVPGPDMDIKEPELREPSGEQANEDQGMDIF